MAMKHGHFYRKVSYTHPIYFFLKINLMSVYRVHVAIAIHMHHRYIALSWLRDAPVYFYPWKINMEKRPR